MLLTFTEARTGLERAFAESLGSTASDKVVGGQSMPLLTFSLPPLRKNVLLASFFLHFRFPGPLQ